jgi:hypothetical protein
MPTTDFQNMSDANYGRSASARRGSTSDKGPYAHGNESPASYWEQGSDQLREITRDHEGQAVLVALAVGFGVGLLLGAALGQAGQKPLWGERATAEGLGRRLLDQVDRFLPDAISERLCR